jgi:desulfoferrodoxin (superoxide reductase-like protein)
MEAGIPKIMCKNNDNVYRFNLGRRVKSTVALMQTQSDSVKTRSRQSCRVHQISERKRSQHRVEF